MAGTPLDSLAAFQQGVLTALPETFRPAGPRAVSQVRITPDPMAYRDDMNHAANLLEDHRDGPVLDYVAQFLDGVARSADDKPLLQATNDLAALRARGCPPTATVKALIAMVQDRISRRVAI